MRVFHLIGVNDTTGIYYFEDSKGNATYNPDYSLDQTRLINIAPKFYGGINNTLTYKNFQLDFTFQFTSQVGRNYLFDPSNAPGSRFFPYMLKDVSNSWKFPGDVSKIQKVTQDFGDARTAYTTASSSDYAYIDASFIRLKNVFLCWHFSKVLLRKLHVQNAQVYFQAQNLFTITKYNGLDPETRTTLALPPLRIIALGCKISL